jgi:hypothetical protein
MNRQATKVTKKHKALKTTLCRSAFVAQENITL